MLPKPIVLCIHGAWHRPICFSLLASQLKAKDIKVDLSVSLPSAGASPPLPDFTADVAAIRQAALAVLTGSGGFGQKSSGQRREDYWGRRHIGCRWSGYEERRQCGITNGREAGRDRSAAAKSTSTFSLARGELGSRPC
jgi:hypothetical protein